MVPQTPPASPGPPVPQDAPAHGQPPPGSLHALPTLIGPPAPAAPPPPSYGYPQPPDRPHLVPGYGTAFGPTTPYGSPQFVPPGPPLPEPAARRSTASTVALLAVALVVAIGAGGAVYVFTQDDNGRLTASPTTSATPSAASSGPSPGSPSQKTPSPQEKNGEGSLPAGYLGTWSGTIDNGSGRSTRELVIQQGEVGDTVLSLTAKGPLGTGGAYHCVFQADLEERPSGGSSVRIGSSRVTDGEPMSSCTPGKPTVLTLLPDGSLRREAADTGESLTYTRSD